MKKAFTLIELLVVIAIIAILAAILFPVFAQAKAAAKKTTALSNAKQLSLAEIMYAGDADDMFPLMITPQGNKPLDGYAGYDYTWQNLIQPYTKSWNLLIDAASPFQHADPIHYLDPFQNFGMMGNSAIDGVATFGDTYYSEGVQVEWNGIGGMFSDTFFWGTGPNNMTPTGGNSLTQTSINNVADNVLIAEATAPDSWTGYPSGGATFDNDMFHYCWTWYASYGTQRTGGLPRYNQTTATTCSNSRHSGGQVVSTFADGHAKALALKEYYKVGTLPDGVTKYYPHLWPN